MFKKFIAILLALALTLSFAACAQKPNNAAASSDNGSTTESKPGKIETDEKLLTVDITLPASMFEDQDMTTFDAKAYANEHDFISTKVNEDGSISVTMTKSRHAKLLGETASSVETAFSEFVDSEETPYIKGFSHNEDFTAVTMKVNRAAYEKAIDFTPIAIAMLVSVYQSLTESDFHVAVTVEDNDTGEIVKVVSIPEKAE